MATDDIARRLLEIVRRESSAGEMQPFQASEAASFVAQCVECDIHPWVHDVLERHQQLSALGDAAAAELGRRRKKVRHDNLLLLARAEQALDLLLERGIVPIALKGLDLLHRVYPRFDQRTLDDVDLLIRREDLEPALEALRSRGWQLPPEEQRVHYIRSSHHLPLRSPGPLPVDFEIHWNLAQEERYRIDPLELFDRALPLEVAGRRILRLETHDLIAHLLVHHFSHYFDRRLKWAVDLVQITREPGFDWSVVADRVESWSGSAACGVSLLHLQKLLAEGIPGEILERLPVSGWRRLATLPLRSPHPLELFRGTRRRIVQLYLAAVMLERPEQLPSWLIHRIVRDRRRSENPLDSDSPPPAVPAARGNDN